MVYVEFPVQSFSLNALLFYVIIIHLHVACRDGRRGEGNCSRIRVGETEEGEEWTLARRQELEATKKKESWQPEVNPQQS